MPRQIRQERGSAPPLSAAARSAATHLRYAAVNGRSTDTIFQNAPESLVWGQIEGADADGRRK